MATLSRRRYFRIAKRMPGAIAGVRGSETTPQFPPEIEFQGACGNQALGMNFRQLKIGKLLDTGAIFDLSLEKTTMKTLLLLLALTLGSGYAGFGADIFAERVRPLLTKACLPCHDTGSRMSGLAVTSIEELLAGGARHGAAVVPGHPEKSVLIRAVRGELAPRMPMGKPPLPAEEIAVLEEWIRGFQPATVSQGGKRWWAFQPVQTQEPPPVQRAEWVRNPVDRFVLAKLEKQGLAPSPEASRRELMRRLYFDLIGLPPSPEEARRFLDDASPRAYEDLVDRLLADSRYGERWARHWLDLARYADTMGFEADREQYHMWRYRDYVVDSFNSDKPYDRFIREQLAGDEIAPKAPASLIATGFLRLGPVFQTTIAAESRQLLLNEVTNTVSSVFLGLTVGCAQCHDHKYDPIPQKDYYRLQAFFQPMELVQTDVPFEDQGVGGRMDAERAAAEKRTAEAQARKAEFEKQLLEKWRAGCAANGCKGEEIAAKNLKNKLLTAIANALVPNDDPAFSLEEKRSYLDMLDYVDNAMGGRDMGMFRRQTERHKPRAHTVRNMTVSGLSPLPPDQFVRLRGDYDQYGERVEPGFPSALPGGETPARLPTDGFGNVRTWRVALANWIASKDNPLTARVMANRIWQHHFGAPLVGTPSDFGRNGGRPTHPEMLDWLATEFVGRSWSIKSMHRLMLNSSAYRQSSRIPSAKAQEKDPANRLLWRMNRRRLEGEAIRDSILAISGRLTTQMAGPGVFPRLPAALNDSQRIKNFTAWEAAGGPEARRRSLYVFQRRQIEFPFLSVMDSPVLQTSREIRPVSTTALQALTLLNGDLVAEESRHFAARVREEAGTTAEAMVRRAFELALSRPPSAAELARAKDFLASEKDGLEGLCRILLNMNELIYVD